MRELPGGISEERITSLGERPDTLVTMHYRCTNPKCKATDKGRFFPDERPFQAITCWKCKAGSGKSLGQMIEQRVGMMAVPAPVEEVEES